MSEQRGILGRFILDGETHYTALRYEVALQDKEWYVCRNEATGAEECIPQIVVDDRGEWIERA